MIHIRETTTGCARPRSALNGCCYKPTARQMAAHKLRKSYLRKIRSREYRKLQAIVPAVANKDKIGKVTVIEEAIKYIDELHSALAQRLQLCPESSLKGMDCMTLLKLVSPLSAAMPIRKPTPGPSPHWTAPPAQSAKSVAPPSEEHGITRTSESRRHIGCISSGSTCRTMRKMPTDKLRM